MEIRVPISVGELLDKISILEIKWARIEDASKRAHVEHELELLRAEQAKLPVQPEVMSDWMLQLADVNEQLWDIEDRIRACEAENRFDEQFVQLARSVYMTNDERSRIKREINLATGSAVVEEKSYHDTGQRQSPGRP